MKIKFLEVKETKGDSIQSPLIVAEIMKGEAKADRECFWVLHLNASNKIIEKELVAIGTANGCMVHPREIFKKAIINGATSIITVHNHPSGQLYPSKEDKMIWERLDEAGKLLKIEILDHIILTASGKYYSKNEGNFPKKKGE